MIPHPHVLGLKPGLIQVEGQGDNLKSTHNPNTGWRLNYPVPPVKIYIQDELTFVNGKVLEIENYIKHYGESIKDVIIYTDVQGLENTYKTLNFYYYPDFSCLHMQDLKRHNINFNFSDKKQFVFLCLNFNIRSHRDRTVNLLQNFPSRLISYKARNWHLPDFTDLSMAEYRDYELYNKNILKNTANLLGLKPIFEKCQFSVVTETRYNLPYTFITEKTTQCFVTLHPALYVSNKYHVASMRDYGFDMFDDIFDHSYDNLNDDIRLNYMIDSNKDVLTNGIKDYHKLENRLIANRNHYFNEQNNIYKMQKR
tara:strand:- start:668 stop:1600 length:933 start_codon:yes stop_codon:yes gene_type:complete